MTINLSFNLYIRECLKKIFIAGRSLKQGDPYHHLSCFSSILDVFYYKALVFVFRNKNLKNNVPGSTTRIKRQEREIISMKKP